MEMLAKREEGRVLSLADYEARIYLYREQIGTGYIGIGRTLIEAKEAGVVPHGEWEAWVTRTTGLETRQAQRCMQAAREIKDGSALAKLEMSKALMVLSSGLEEDEQEAIAARAADEGQGIRQLREEIRKLKEEKDAERAGSQEEIRKLQEAREKEKAESEGAFAEKLREMQEKHEAEIADSRDVIKELKLQVVNGSGAVAEIREKLKAATQERDQVAAQMQAANDAWRKRMDDETGKAYRRGLEESGKELDAANRRVEDLQAELIAAEKREAKRAAEMAEMKKARAQAGMDAARGIGGTALGAVDLAAAVRSFIGAAGVLPQMGNLISGMSEKERETIRANVETVARWVADSRKALGVVMADAQIV